MAVVLAVAITAASIFRPITSLQSEPYDGVAIESQDSRDVASEGTEVPDFSMLDPRAYLYSRYARVAKRLDCVFQRESRWDPRAYNRRSGAEGLAQFIASTWYSTPQGKAGAQRTDPIASIDASVFLIEQTPQSFKHWSVVLQGMC